MIAVVCKSIIRKILSLVWINNLLPPGCRIMLLIIICLISGTDIILFTVNLKLIQIRIRYLFLISYYYLLFVSVHSTINPWLSAENTILSKWAILDMKPLCSSISWHNDHLL